jgi:hypothetical protein
MVARDVVAFCSEYHIDPFQSGFDSQHRHELSDVNRRCRWINTIDLVFRVFFFSLFSSEFIV